MKSGSGSCRKLARDLRVALGAAATVVVITAAACGSGANALSSQNPSATPLNESSSTVTAAKVAGIAAAHAYLSASDTAILTVNGAEVSARDLAFQLQETRDDLAGLEAEIAEATSSASLERLQSRFDLIQAAGIENVALGSLITYEGWYAEATRLGIAPSDSDIAAYVDHFRTTMNKVDLGFEQGVADALGDVYWTDFLPRQARYALVKKSLTEEETKGITDLNEAGRAWAELQIDLVDNASVKILDPAALGSATVEGAKSYVDQYQQLVAVGG